MSTTTNEMKGRLAQYLNRQCSLEEFDDWFAVALRDAHKSDDKEAESLAHAIEWAFCDLERGAPGEQVRNTLIQLAEAQTGNLLVFGKPLVLGTAPYSTGTSDTSSTLLALAASGSMGRPQILREMVPE
jgi:hypothetical protein